MAADKLHPRRYAAIVDDLYRGVEDPDAWADAVCRIGETLHAPVVARHSFDLVRGVGVVVGIRGIPSEPREACGVLFGRTNAWMSRARGRITVGGLVVSDDRLTEREPDDAEWHECFPRHLRTYRSIGAVLEIEGDVSTTLLFARPRAHGPYTQAERRLLLSFVPHLRNVHRFRTRMATLDAVRRSLATALDALGHGVLLAEADGRISFLNPAARRILELRDGLSLRPDGLHAADAAEDALLHERIEAVSSGALSAEPLDELALVSRLSGARPLEVLVVPLPASVPATGSRSSGALVLLHDPSAVPASAASRLRAAFGLTPAEARLAELVADGTDLPTAAAQLQITVETARTHLKRVFGKTNTHRQAQLAQLLLGSLARVRTG